MKIKLLVITLGISTFIGCSNEEIKKQLSELKIELEQTKAELNNCSVELTEIKNTAENRFIRAQKSLSENNLEGAKIEFQGIVDNFKGTKDATIASNEIAKIDKIVEQKRIEEERKKALGFKILKPVSTVKFDDLSLQFDKIWTGKRWSFDDYGSEYRLRDAQRGNIHILARVSISSETKNPSLPPVLVYQMNNGELELIGTLGYEFRRWEDYGSYLGNNADYGNDFAHSKTIPFNLGLQVSDDIFVGKIVYIVMKKTGCFERRKKDYGNPEIQYSEGICSAKRTLKVEDFDNDYVLLKKIQ
ncbi:hypothetical protein EC396_13300 [Lutibacter sp. HS1-25]|uniref:hypothetical protein n=1 Tax=Lutibacter sp. HS1-25 TaxID=2485000 RepID=UPI001012EF46|nr:hypothetical protein [Lutibacter sp. HS1-25]RXP46852.1 hypothetical protein EC396_13300 [Lutibacter sp. HS1-25]